MMSLPSEATDLGKILEKTQNLLANHGVTVKSRSLAQLSQITKRMAQQHDINFDMNAQMFFAKRGLDITKQQQLLQSIEASHAQTVETVEPSVDWDVNRWMENQQSQLLSSVIEECDQYNNLTFQDMFASRLDDDWSQAKRDILESMSFELKQTDSSFVPAATAPNTVLLKTSMDPEQELFARAVEHYNKARRQAITSGDILRINPVVLFRDVARKVDTDTPTDMTFEAAETWELLANMTAELETLPANASDAQRQQAMVVGACRFLETLFRAHVRDTLASEQALDDDTLYTLDTNRTPANTVRLITAYTESRLFRSRFATAEDTAVNPASIWTKAFCCFRAGDAAAAASVLREGMETGLNADALLDCLDRHRHGADPGAVWERLFAEYSADAPETSDPFRVALYHAVGRFALDSSKQLRARVTRYVHAALEDYLWHRLAVLWCADAPLPSWLALRAGVTQQSLSLEALQAHLLKVGVQKLARPAEDGSDACSCLFVRVLLMTQQFEQAVARVLALPHASAPAFAAHLTIGLLGCDLLHCTPASAQTLTPRDRASENALVDVSATSTSNSNSSSPSATAGAPTAYSLNAHRILLKYAESFHISQPLVALHYLYTLRMIPRPENSGIERPHTILTAPPASHSSSVSRAKAVVGSLVAGAATSAPTADLGLDFEPVVDLLCSTQALPELVGVDSHSWMPLRSITSRGAIPQLYSPAACQVILRETASRLIQLNLVEAALALLALSEAYVVMGIVILNLLCRSVAEGNTALSARLTVLARRLLVQCADVSAQRLPPEDVHALCGSRDVRLGDLSFLLSVLRTAIAVTGVLDAGAGVGPHQVSQTPKDVITAVAALGLFPASHEPSEWGSVHATVSALPHCLQELYGPLALTYYNALSAYLGSVENSMKNAQRTGDTQTFADMGKLAENVRDRLQVVVSFVLNRFDFVSREVSAALLSRH